MSHQPSPGPPSLHNNQMYHQPSLPSSSSKLRTKPFTNTLPGGAEDVKYQAKYKELKKKVKEIELDNDRLYLKLLLAKKNIRRMNLERAILYERLAAVPPTPGRHTQELPPEHDPMYAQQPSGPPHASHSVDPQDQALQDYLRNNPNARPVQGPDGRVVAIEDPAATNGTREHTSGTGVLPPHGLPLVQGYHEQNRQLPPLPLPMPSIREPHDEPSTSNKHGHHAAPRTTVHSNNNTAHHSRGAPGRADRDAAQVEPARLDTLSARHSAHSRSSSASGEGHGEPRSRHPDIHELASQQGPPHTQAQSTSPEMPPSPAQTLSPTHGRLHNHQRIGPGVHLHRQQERDPEVTRQLLREREVEREREREREIALRERMAIEEEELRQVTMWARRSARGGADPSREGSQSESHGTAGGSRPSSGQSHEPERNRPYPPRVANLLVHEPDYYDERTPGFVSNTRGYVSEQPPASSDSRKRSRNDMEIDSEYGSTRSPANREGSTAGSADAYPVSHDIRGSKRVHADEEDVALGRVSSVRDERMDQDD